MMFGLQKLTLLDYPEKVACTVFCSGCNFRCPFCHNPALATGNESILDYSFSDIIIICACDFGTRRTFKTHKSLCFVSSLPFQSTPIRTRLSRCTISSSASRFKISAISPDLCRIILLHSSLSKLTKPRAMTSFSLPQR